MLADFIVATHSLTPAPASKGAVSLELGRVLPSSGHGYLAGEFPGGITSVDGVPTSATVRILYRPGEGEPGDGVVVATTQSGQDGTWRVEGLDTSKLFDVIGRADGFNDVIMSRISPISMVDITYAGAVAENETFTGAVGFLELVGGIPPYAASVVDPLPAGIFPVVNGRQLIIDGTTTDDDVFNSTVRITSSNGVTKDVPVKLVVGFKAPANFEAETIEYAGAFSVVLTWEVTNTTQELLVFKSATPFDLESMPAPIATLTGNTVSYTDDDVIEDDVFYYMVASVCEGFTLYSDGVMEVVVVGDPHWDNVVSLLYFDGNSVDEKGRLWNVVGTPDFNDAGGVFGTKCMYIKPSTSEGLVSPRSEDFSMGVDLTIEVFAMFNSGDGSERSIFEFNGSLVNNRDRLYVDKLPNYGIRVAYGGLFTLLTKDTEKTYQPEVLHHIALTITASGYIELFVNGLKELSFDSSNNLPVGSLVAAIGTLPSGPHAVNYRGRLDMYRVTRGVIRYTENFTPPTEPFPNE